MGPYTKEDLNQSTDMFHSSWLIRDHEGHIVAQLETETAADLVLAIYNQELPDHQPASVYFQLHRRAVGEVGPSFGPFGNVHQFDSKKIMMGDGTYLTIRDGVVFYDGEYYRDWVVIDGKDLSDFYQPNKIDQAKAEWPESVELSMNVEIPMTDKEPSGHPETAMDAVFQVAPFLQAHNCDLFSVDGVFEIQRVDETAPEGMTDEDALRKIIALAIAGDRAAALALYLDGRKVDDDRFWWPEPA